jgi:hypothetical protein
MEDYTKMTEKTMQQEKPKRFCRFTRQLRFGVGF